MYDDNYSQITKINYDKTIEVLVKKGNGMGEIYSPESVLFFDTYFLVTFFDGMIKSFDYHGNVLFEQLMPANFIPMDSSFPFQNGFLLVSGRVPFKEGLHVLDSKFKEQNSFYIPEKHMENNNLRSVGWLNVIISGDTIGVLHSLQPTIEFYNSSGEIIKKIALKMPDFYTLPNFNFAASKKDDVLEETFLFNKLFILKNRFVIQLFKGNPRTTVYLCTFDRNGNYLETILNKQRVIGHSNAEIITLLNNSNSFTIDVLKITLK